MYEAYEQQCVEDVERCDDDSGQHSHEAVLGHDCQNAAQAVSGKFLKSFAHGLHTIEEQTERSEQ